MYQTKPYHLFITLIIILFIILSNYRYDNIVSYYGVVNNGNLEVDIKQSDTHNLLNKNLIIDKQVVNYEVIDNKIIYVLDTPYNHITLKLHKYKLYDQSVVLMGFKLGKTTYISEISNFIKKGMIEWRN